MTSNRGRDVRRLNGGARDQASPADQHAADQRKRRGGLALVPRRVHWVVVRSCPGGARTALVGPWSDYIRLGSTHGLEAACNASPPLGVVVDMSCDESAAHSSDAGRHRFGLDLPPVAVVVEAHLLHEYRFANRRQSPGSVAGANDLASVDQPHPEGSGSPQASHVDGCTRNSGVHHRTG